MTRNAITSVAPPGDSGGNALALQVGHGLDAGAVDRHHMHAVWVDHEQRLQRHLVVLEFVVALQRIQRGIRHGERQFALAGADQFQIVDRTAGDFRGGLHIGKVFRRTLATAPPSG